MSATRWVGQTHFPTQVTPHKQSAGFFVEMACEPSELQADRELLAPEVATILTVAYASRVNLRDGPLPVALLDMRPTNPDDWGIVAKILDLKYSSTYYQTYKDTPSWALLTQRASVRERDSVSVLTTRVQEPGQLSLVSTVRNVDNTKEFQEALRGTGVSEEELRVRVRVHVHEFVTNRPNVKVIVSCVCGGYWHATIQIYAEYSEAALSLFVLLGMVPLTVCNSILPEAVMRENPILGKGCGYHPATPEKVYPPALRAIYNAATVPSPLSRRKGAIVLLSGAEGCGKSTLAHHLSTDHSFLELSFAEALRETMVDLWEVITKNITMNLSPIFTMAIEPFSIEASHDQSRKNGPMHIYTKGASTEMRAVFPAPESGDVSRALSHRWLLQHIGTEVLRRHLGEDVWANAVVSKIREHERRASGPLRVVISDCRFANELRCLRAALPSDSYTVVHARINEAWMSDEDRALRRQIALASGHVSTHFPLQCTPDFELWNSKDAQALVSMSAILLQRVYPSA